MAAMIKHRKLFPALTEINQTTDCSDIYYNCDTELYFPPPPPPTSPLSDADHHITPFTIAIICILSSIFLLVSYYVIIAKSCTGWCGLRTRTTTIAAAAESPPRAAQSDGGREEEEFLEENRTDHPIWFITTVGLQQSIINSITICKYKKNDGLIEGTECSVCLNEFQEEETLRLLPKCSHAFHIPCIDTWLRSHTNCPLCRAHIVSAEGVVSSGSSNGESEMGSSEINLELNRGERETGDGEDSILMTDSSSSGNVNSGDSSSEPVLVEPEGSSKMSSKSN